jgi:L-asparaginase / beta-aspartyl-peptidase
LNKSKANFGIVTDGGAGSLVRLSRNDIDERRRVLKQASSEGYEILKKGGSSVDAVERAIIVLEDSKIFNAGSGSCVTIEGKVEPDASIMTGDLSCGSVANASIAKNPISLARLVMEKSDHVFIAGPEALTKFAMSTDFAGLEELKPTKQRLEQYKVYLKDMEKGALHEWPKNSSLLNSYREKAEDYGSGDTVGSVAIDSDGKVCAGVSTGGRFMKLAGRIGDSAIPGAGLYADKHAGAASATGEGEEIIKVCLCKTVSDLMRSGIGAQSACESAIDLLTNARGPGTAGVIAVDSGGRFGISRNTEMMPVSLRFPFMESTLSVVLPEEYDKLAEVESQQLASLKRLRL